MKSARTGQSFYFTSPSPFYGSGHRTNRENDMTYQSGTKPERISEERCTDYAIGRNAFAYLEKKLSDDRLSEQFAAHAVECDYCLKTMVRWHYDAAVEKIENSRKSAVRADEQLLAGLDFANWRSNNNGINDELFH